MIKNIKPKSKILNKLAPLLLALAVIVAYSRLFIVPTIKSLRDLRPKVNALKQNVQLAETNIKTIEILKKELNDLKSRIGNYENRLPQKKEIPTILQHLSEIAAQSGVKITSIEPAKEAAASLAKDYSEVPINLTAKCGYHQLAAFISQLENSRQFMKVSNIKISRNQSDSYHHNVDLKISTFIIAEDGNLNDSEKK